VAINCPMGFDICQPKVFLVGVKMTRCVGVVAKKWLHVELHNICWVATSSMKISK
jgi:hypothetical protein